MSGQKEGKVNARIALSSLGESSSGAIINGSNTALPVLPMVASLPPRSCLAAPTIQSLLPHSGTMILLDRFVAADEERLCAEVVIRPDSLFSGVDGVGSWIGIEYMAQSIAAFAGYKTRLSRESVKVGFLLGTRHFHANCTWFRAGAVLWILVKRLMQAENGLGSFECAIYDVTDCVNKDKHGPMREKVVSFDVIGDIVANAQVVVRATVTVFQPHDVAGFLEGIVE